MTYAEAADQAMNHGKAITRKNWNEKGQYVYFNPENNVSVTHIWNENNSEYFKKIKQPVVTVGAHFGIKNAQDQIVPGWNPSPADLAATDWEIFEI